MGYATFLWAVVCAISLLLAIQHASIWLMDRKAYPSLAFAATSISLIAVAFTELQMMHSHSVAEWAEWVRWSHIPIFTLMVSTMLFVRLYLGAGNWWLLATVVGLRLAILVANFMWDPNFNFERIVSVEPVRFLGEEVTAVSEAVPRSAQWLATLANALFALYFIDATRTAWRAGSGEDRRKAALIGGSHIAFCVLGALSTQVVIWGIVVMPTVLSPPFLVPLFAMAFELSRDALRASRLARDLKESERNLELAVASAGLGLWSLNGERAMWATRRSREMFGIGETEGLDASRAFAVVHADDQSNLRRTLEQTMASGGEYAVEFRVCPPGGEVRWIAGRGQSERFELGRPAALRGVLRDITEIKRSEAEFAELRSELAHAGRVTMLGQLASSITHELGQPLGAILRNSEAAKMMLQDPAPDLEEVRAIVADIHRDDQRAHEVIGRLREMLKRGRVELQPIRLDSWLQDVASLVKQDAASKGIALSVSAPSDAPWVSGDRVQLSQILINLLLNAFDAAVESDFPRKQVSVDIERQTNEIVEISVRDSGNGVPAGDIKRIFDPFFTTKATGMGLGLAVSRTIAEAHGGRLWAENGDASGAVFRLSLPILHPSA